MEIACSVATLHLLPLCCQEQETVLLNSSSWWVKEALDGKPS